MTTLTTDQETILQLHREFIEANKVGDVDFLRQHMIAGDDLIWDNLNKSIYLGVDHICRLWEYLRFCMGDRSAEAEVWDEQVHVVGDLAWIHAMMVFRADFGPLGKVDMPSRETEIWQRIDTEWKMVHFHCSSHQAGEAEGGL